MGGGAAGRGGCTGLVVVGGGGGGGWSGGLCDGFALLGIAQNALVPPALSLGWSFWQGDVGGQGATRALMM